MKKKINEDEKILYIQNNEGILIKNELNSFLKKINYKILLFLIFIFVNDIIIFYKFPFIKDTNNNRGAKINLENTIYNSARRISLSKHTSYYLMKLFTEEKNRPCLQEINKKRTFENRFPLSKEINCKPHLTEKELIAFLSFLTKNITYFETGSGCSSLIAKYYAKKSYAVEGCKEFYQQGIKNGLKEKI